MGFRLWQSKGFIYEYAKDPAVGPIAGWPVHTSVENSKAIIKKVLSANETYAVCLKEDNRAIGSIGLLPSAQSHTDAAEDEMEIGCSTLWCGYYDGNEKSRRCQEKCGFIYHHTEENKPCDLMGDIRTEHFS